MEINRFSFLLWYFGIIDSISSNNERELKIKMIIQWIHLYNSCDDDLQSVTRLKGRQLTDDLCQKQK